MLISLLLLSFFSCDEMPPVIDEEPLPIVSLDPLSVSEGNESRSVFASVRLSAAAKEKVVIFVESMDGTATSGTDYVTVSEVVEFEVGSVQENIKLQIIGDAESETDEDFTLSIVDVVGATISQSSIIIVIENDDIGTGNVVIPSTGYSTPNEYDGFSLIWNDEFEGETLNEDFWTFEIGNGTWGWGNNELEYYRKDNTELTDGFIVIEARDEKFGGFNYTSSRIITKNKFDFTFGRIDVRAVIPEGQGIWPAIWMLGSNISEVGWPRCGEIDIMELVGHQPSKLHSTVHYSDSSGNRIMNGSSTTLPASKKFSQDFHVFSIIWEKDRIEFLLDDVPFHVITRASLGSQNPYPFNDPFFFIFNVAVGGNWPGSPDSTTKFPQHMIVDYIRVFQPI